MTTKTKTTPKHDQEVSTDLAVAIIIDKSGSMGGLRHAVVDGFNKYIADLREQEGLTFLSLTFFDTQFSQPYVGTGLDRVSAMTTHDYVPGGFTALYDAIGYTVETLDKKLKKEGKEDTKVLVVTMTDGMENSSREFTAERLKDLVANYEEKGNWTFTYIGFGQSLQYVETVRGSGYTSDNAYVAAASADGMNMAMSNLSVGSATLRGSKSRQTANIMADASVDMDSVADLPKADDPTVDLSESSLLDQLNGGK